MDLTPLDFLKKEFERRKKERSSYSLRNFARDLDFNSGVMSQILAGKRNITRKTAEKLERFIQMTEDERYEYYAEFRRKDKLKGRQPEQEAKMIDEGIDSIEHFFILTCFKMTTFEPTFDNFSEFLNIPEHRVQERLDDLQKAGLVQLVDEDKKLYSRIEAPVRMYRSDNSNETINKMNEQILEFAKGRVDVENAVFKNVLVPTNKESYQLVSKELDKVFHVATVAATDNKECDSLYCFMTAFFPVNETE